MRTALNYFLYTRSINPQPLQSFATNTPKTNQFKPEPKPEPDDPAEIDTTINTHTPWEDSLNTRKGWIRN